MIDEEYSKRWYTHYMARGERYKAMHPERIPLRAFWVEIPEQTGCPGIALPDGRMILADGRSSICSYSSERVLCNRIPGARIFWDPDADVAINEVSDE